MDEKAEKINYNERNPMQEIGFHDLEFKKIPIRYRSSRGNEYFRKVSVGMPKIPKRLIDCTFYLYSNKEDAEKGINYGGTGFFITVPSEKYPNEIIYIHAVTNWHNVLKNGYSIIRVNTLDGTTDIIELEPTEWEWIPNKDDLVISPPLTSLDPKKHSANLIPIELFATKNIIDKYGIDVGDNVFMVGRFMDHDGGIINMPAVRFGNISVMPTEIRQPTGYKGKSYCIDLHSRSGYSGSPVFVYRTPGTNLDITFETGLCVIDAPWDSFCYLLGIHWGQFPEEWEIKEIKIKENKSSFESRSIITEGAYIEGFSGMTLVIPAQSILSLLEMPNIKNERAKGDLRYGIKRRQTGLPPKAESEPILMDNPQHKEDFNSLLIAAVKKKLPIDET